MIWDVITCICFATLAAIVFESIKEVYKWTSPKYINKKRLIQRIDNMEVGSLQIINNKCEYLHTQIKAQYKLETLNELKEIINSL